MKLRGTQIFLPKNPNYAAINRLVYVYYPHKMNEKEWSIRSSTGTDPQTRKERGTAGQNSPATALRQERTNDFHY